MYGGKFAFQNRLGIYWEKYASQNPLHSLIVGRKFMSVICSNKFLLKHALRT